MRLLSEASEYALRAAVWLAGSPPGFQTTQKIASETQATPGYLAHVLQEMAKAGILRARRGAGGGFELAGDPREITALQVVNSVDPVERITRCPLGLERHKKRLCSLHRRIDDATAQVEAALAETTIASMLTEPGAASPLCVLVKTN
jgi:Rrf2 family protein